jgi:threonine/homoserine/homoserine lactone efflux protein
MMHVETLLSVAVLWIFAVIVPGPNFLMTVRIAITRSRREALLAVAGIGAGTAIWSAAGCFGVQALFLAVPWMYAALKAIGGAYLIVMGARLVARSWRTDPAAPAKTFLSQINASAFQLGFLTMITNPKSAVFVASIFATTMPPDPPPLLSLAVMATMISVSVGWYCLVTCLFTTRRLANAYQRARHWIDRAAGTCFILFGARLVAER